MKCLISIGLILPALAAVIGVAAWAVSADVVMNSGNNNRGGGRSVDNNLLQQHYAAENDNRPDIFRMNIEKQPFQPRAPQSFSTTTTSPRTTTTTTTTTTTPVPSQTLSPKEVPDMSAILSKLISASGAASGGNGTRFVVIAPLPDNTEPLQGSQSGVSRLDRSSGPTNAWHPRTGNDQDLAMSESFPNAKILPPPKDSSNFTNRVNAAAQEANRRMSKNPLVINVPNAHRTEFKHQIELTGFEPFDSMMQQESSLNPKPSVVQRHQDPPPGFAPFKRGPPMGHFGPRNPMPAHHFEHKEKHIFNPRPEHTVHGFKSNNPLGIGLKPIQQQMHHVDQMQTAESSRWGSVGFPPGGGYVHKPPEGISLSISSPAHSGTHVSSEPVSVIKSFFLPFLPKPRLNMNARVVFGVVLDKGVGVGGKKEGPHLG